MTAQIILLIERGLSVATTAGTEAHLSGTMDTVAQRTKMRPTPQRHRFESGA